MTLLQSSDSLLILLLNLSESLVPSLVELLVLHEVSLLNFFAFSSLIVYQLFAASIEILDFKFFNAVLCHLGFDIFTLSFALLSMIFQDSSISQEIIN
jgi:hypothetical protein